MKRSSLVARPRATTSSPVAIGSSVPAWPMRRMAKRRRQRATTSWDVHPPAPRGLLEQGCHPGRAGDAEVVDEPIEIPPGEIPEIGRLHPGPDEAEIGFEHGPAEHGGRHLEVTEGN